MKRVLVTGARSAVGAFLLPLLLEHECTVLAVSRRGREVSGAGVRWLRADLRAAPPALGPFDVWIHLARLDLLPRWLEGLSAPPNRLIAFSTTSVLSKAASSDPAERELAARLLDAERRVQRLAEERGVAWTLFRPTMIYGTGRDHNVAFIARWVRRWRLFPLVGAGRGARQPVHAADLARACLLALDARSSHGQTYVLGGGEVLTYREMVDRIFRAEGLTPRYLQVSEHLLCLAVQAAAHLPGLRFLSPAMVQRMNQDLAFDIGPAERDLGYRPRPFEPEAGAKHGTARNARGEVGE
ncbi:MAG TPA: NAD(P)-dependent oxidoreductase [Chromatiales bacterium]|nr:NAD(P)-dependent oxidoreductase [Chromatiales bacterium]